MIYALQCKADGLYKFGLAGSERGARRERLRYARRQLARELGRPVVVEFVVFVDWHYKEEGMIHEHLENQHVFWEWFRDGPEVQAVLELMKSDRYIAWQRLRGDITGRASWRHGKAM